MGKSSHAISGAFVFMLLGIFAIFSTVMVLLSAKAYRGVVDKAAMHNSMRVASSYIRTMPSYPHYRIQRPGSGPDTPAPALSEC